MLSLKIYKQLSKYSQLFCLFLKILPFNVMKCRLKLKTFSTRRVESHEAWQWIDRLRSLDVVDIFSCQPFLYMNDSWKNNNKIYLVQGFPNCAALPFFMLQLIFSKILRNSSDFNFLQKMPRSRVFFDSN